EGMPTVAEAAPAASPFADIDAGLTEPVGSFPPPAAGGVLRTPYSVPSAPVQPARSDGTGRKTGGRGPLIAAALVLLAAGVTVFFALNKGRTPPSSPVAEKPEPVAPRPVAKKQEPPASPERREAEWFLKNGKGALHVLAGTPEQPIDVNQPGQIPAVPFKVTDVVLRNITDADLEHLRPFDQLTGINLEGAGVTDAGLERLAAFPAAGRYTALWLSSNPGVTDAGMA